MGKMKRIVYRVVPDKQRGDWRVTKDGKKCGRAPTKELAVAFGRVNARREWANGKLSQLVVCKADGTVQDEYTYGKDPVRSRG